eukprot:6639651-Prorocentrum_lima.AAC.1
MTSSLVGSEMCIRDRKNKREQTSARHRERHTQRQGDKVNRENPQNKKPVSYTHLTLPTICSV